MIPIPTEDRHWAVQRRLRDFLSFKDWMEHVVARGVGVDVWVALYDDSSG